jgi:transcriptional regulator with XRE-family HTH domain
MTPNPSSSDIPANLPKPIALDALQPITAARLKLGMSLNDLAQAARIDPAHLELMERRSHYASPTLAELERLAAILQVSVDEIR